MFILLRIIVLSVFAAAGAYAGLRFGMLPLGAVAGLLTGAAAFIVENSLKRISIGSITGGFIGLFAGLATAVLLIEPFKTLAGEGFELADFILKAVLAYGGLLVGLKKGEKLTIQGIYRMIRGQASEANIKILDTSVIIDGRIADICDVGFVEGVFVVPQFILEELQHVADSPDPLKRARGRRGLDVLHKIQKMSHIDVRIIDEDFPKIKEVDSKLVALAKVMNAKVVTNDFNLNKVAELQGVSVLNINELSNAIKPVVLPGETIRVFIIKEGKEQNQGVAYLDDGTMVVVDNGRRLIGKNIDVTVTSVLQTTAGRMIFTKTKDDYDHEEQRAHRPSSPPAHEH